jgi:hypothetical protein
VEAGSGLILDSLRQGIRQGSFSNIPPMRRCPASIYALIPVRCTQTLELPPRSGQGILSRRRRELFSAGREFIRRSRDAHAPSSRHENDLQDYPAGFGRVPSRAMTPMDQPDTYFRRFDDDASLIAH